MFNFPHLDKMLTSIQEPLSGNTIKTGCNSVKKFFTHSFIPTVQSLQVTERHGIAKQNAVEIFIQQRRVLLLVPLDLLFKKDCYLLMKNW